MSRTGTGGDNHSAWLREGRRRGQGHSGHAALDAARARYVARRADRLIERQRAEMRDLDEQVRDLPLISRDLPTAPELS